MGHQTYSRCSSHLTAEICGGRLIVVHRHVDEFTAMAEKWRYWGDGRDLVPICPDCARREFALDAPASGG